MKRPGDIELLRKFQKLRPEVKCAFNDKDFSKLFSDTHTDKCRFNVDEREWFIYTGKVWERDAGAMTVRQYAKTFVDTLLSYSVQIEDEQKKAEFLKYISKLSQYRFRDTLIKDARDNYVLRNRDLDAYGNLFNCQNGTLNLTTFELLPHSPSDLLLKIANVEYLPEAVPQRFLQFIGEIMKENKAKIRYLQKIFGYALTANTDWETCFILYGKSTRNGKSTLIETIAYMLGGGEGYALTMQPASLAQKPGRDGRQASGDIARLKGCRFLSVSEFPQKMIFDVALLKQLTGRDKIVARQLYGSEFEFYPCFKLFMNTNSLPMVNDETLFLSGRIQVITFSRHFEPDEQEIDLKDKLKQPHELSGILNWCLDGLRQYRQHGRKVPKAVMIATRKYQDTSNKITVFLSDCLEPGNNVKVKTVYDAYKLWCEANSYPCEGKSVLMNELKKRGLHTPKARVNGRTETNVVCGKQIKREYLAPDTE